MADEDGILDFETEKDRLPDHMIRVKAETYARLNTARGRLTVYADEHPENKALAHLQGRVLTMSDVVDFIVVAYINNQRRAAARAASNRGKRQ